MENPLPMNPPHNASSWSLSLCRSTATSVLLPLLYSLLFLAGLPGNSLSLWVFLHRIPSRTPTHIYLTHLGLSNLVLSLTTPFLAAYYAWGSAWSRAGALCQLALYGITPVLHANIYVGVLLLTWLALSRFATLVRRPHASGPSALLPSAFSASLKRAPFARVVCAGVWVVVAGAILPVTGYYAAKEAVRDDRAAAGEEDGGSERRGGGGGGREREVCYNAEVEVGGSVSMACSVPAVTLFLVCFLLVTACYVAVLRHIRRSRRRTCITNTNRLLGKVFRNIVIIQVILTVCLLPHHIFRTIFISLSQDHLTRLGHSTPTSPCHPLSTLIEVKNLLLCLAAARVSTDPVMYFLLDKTFRKHTLHLLKPCPYVLSHSQSSGSVPGRGYQECGQSGVHVSHDGVL